MRPGRFSAMRRRATSMASRYGPRRFVSSTASTSSTDILWARAASGMPALFTRMSTGPKAASAASTAATIWSASVMSSGTPTQVPPGRGDLGLHLVEPVLAAPRGDHRGAGLGEGDGEAAAEAGGGAGDEGDLAGQVDRHVLRDPSAAV